MASARAGWRPLNPVIGRITARALLGRRRALLLAPLPLLLIALAAAGRSMDDPAGWANQVVNGLGVSAILPLVALIIGTSVLGSEIEDGSAVALLAKPVARRDVVLTKLAVAFAVTALLAALPVFLAGLAATGEAGGLTAGYTVGALAGSVVYCALFLALSLVTRRAVAVGLLYVLLWEGVLGSLVVGAKYVSVRQYLLGMAHSVASSDLIDAHLSAVVAVVMSILVTAAAAALAVNRLRSFSLKGEST